MEENGRVRVEGVVADIRYRNDENAYTVLEMENGDDPLTVVGYFPLLGAGETIAVEGEFVRHPTYGRQFRADSISVTLPESETAIRAYLASGVLPGIGEKLAARLVDHFGADTLDALENRPLEVAQVKGITREKAIDLQGRVAALYGMKRMMLRLQEMGIPAYLAARLYKYLGSDAPEILQQNPYLLCEDFFGLTFERADEIARQGGVSDGDPVRVRAGIKHVLRHNLQNGHTFLPREPLLSVACTLLEQPSERVETELAQLCDDREVIRRSVGGVDGIYLSRYFEAERYIAEKLPFLLYSCTHFADGGAAVESVEKRTGITYAALQKKAISLAAENGVLILTGGPGTGKTTTLNGMLQLFSDQGWSVLLAAPTGRAAKRMSEITGMEAKTLHRLLEVSASDGRFLHFIHDERNPLKADVVVVDEMSMVDVLVFEALLRALRPGTKLVLVGDADQLPPVGAGRLLLDIISCDLFPVVRLTEIFRQAADSLIVVNAHRINEGEMPSLDDKTNDFFFLPRSDRDDAALTVRDLCQKRLPARYGLDAKADIQVLCPARKGVLGTHSLNTILQQALNPAAEDKPQLKYKDLLFRVGDKVMQTRNNYDLPYLRENGEEGAGIFNGDIGTILEMDKRAEEMRIQFDDRIARYPFVSLEDLELAYAVTVHKSQGSEFPAVILPLMGGTDRLMTRNLLYTAVTRAKELCIVVGTKEAVEQMVANYRETRRYSGIKYLLWEGEDEHGTT